MVERSRAILKTAPGPDARRRHHAVGMIAAQFLTRREADPKDVRFDDRHDHRALTIAEGEAIGLLARGWHRPERRPLGYCRRRRQQRPQSRARSAH